MMMTIREEDNDNIGVREMKETATTTLVEMENEQRARIKLNPLKLPLSHPAADSLCTCITQFVVYTICIYYGAHYGKTTETSTQRLCCYRQEKLTRRFS